MSDSPVDRRSFFSLGFRRVLGSAIDQVEKKVSAGGHIRPPGALVEPAFLAACTRCGECERACPVHAIRPLGTQFGLASGTPVLNPALTACVMCDGMPCAAACPTPALEIPDNGWRDVRMSRITIDEDRCIAFNNTECGVCTRVCPVGEDALRLDARGRPVIGDACTGCGSCVGACVTAPSSILVNDRGRLN